MFPKPEYKKEEENLPQNRSSQQMTSMDESAMKGTGFKRANHKHRDVLSVEGYDTKLQPYYVELLLEKHFSPCGKLSEIIVSRDSETGLLKSSACISFYGGDDAYEEALNLSGSYLRGWKLAVARGNYSDYIDDTDTHTVADADTDTDGEEGDGDVESDSTDDEFAYGDNEMEEFKNEERGMFVRGLDRRASNLDVKIKMCEYFASCGEVTHVSACNDGPSECGGWADVSIVGQGATDMAQELSVCEADGWNIKVDIVFPSRAERRERCHQQYMTERMKKKTTRTSE